MEEWRDVEGYKGIYKISNFANLKSLDRKVKINGKNQFTTFESYKNVKGKDIAKVVNQHGYYQVVLYKNGKKKNMLLHRLVALAFIPNSENKPTVNHKDGNRLNDNVNNLEWATQQEQQDHAINVLGFKPTISKKCRKRQIELHQRKVKRSDGIVFESIKIASDGNESLRKHINACCRGQRKTAGGYSWEYV